MSDVLVRTPVGKLREGDEFYFRRSTMFGRDQTGWVTARSIPSEGDWVYGVDRRGRCRSISISDITRIKRNKNG